MNYLAHILLSGPDPDMQVGGLLGDFVKGPLRGEYAATVESGIQLHRNLDCYADGLPETGALLMHFPAPWRRYAGIVVDVWFDHLLARRWHQYHAESLGNYCAAFYRHLETCRPWLPEHAHAFSVRAPQVGWLERYADDAVVPGVLKQVGGRLRRPVPLEQAWVVVQHKRAVFEATFAPVMEKLQAFAVGYQTLNQLPPLNQLPQALISKKRSGATANTRPVPLNPLVSRSNFYQPDGLCQPEEVP